MLLEISQKSQENTCARVSLLIKLQKKETHRCFPVNFVKVLRTPFLKEHFRWLRLHRLFAITIILSLFILDEKYVGGKSPCRISTKVQETQPLIPKDNQINRNIEDQSKSKGLSIVTAIFFVVGDVIGAGVVALPYAMKLVSWVGIPMFLFCSTLMYYCGFLLALACTKVMKNVDRNNLRDPYPRLGYEASGKGGKYITTISLAINQVLTCIVFILLAGEIFLELFPSSPWDHFTYRTQLRIWFCMCGLFLLPFTFLGTPKDFKGIGFLAMVTSGLAVVLIAVMLGYISSYQVDNDKSLILTGDGFLHAFGTVLFGFGGVSIFPTIQNDMEQPEKFTTSITIGYFIISIIYIVTPLGAYIILGDLIKEDLLTTFSYLELYFSNHLFRTFCMAAQACICGHVLCAFVLNMNPIYQQIEGMMGIPLGKCLHNAKTD